MTGRPWKYHTHTTHIIKMFAAEPTTGRLARPAEYAKSSSGD